MARLPRLAIDHQLHHLVHRAGPDRKVFERNDDRVDYLAILLELARELRVAIHAYVLLPEQVQLLLTPQRGDDIALMMQRLGRRFVSLHNRRHGLAGSPWRGRFHTSVLQPSLYLLDAMCHLETRPVFSGLVNRPEEWPASSAAHHSGLRFDPLITDHPIFWKLGNTPFERESAYRQYCDSQGGSEHAMLVDQGTSKGWAVGDAAFIAALALQQARRLQPNRRGRPRAVKMKKIDSDPI